MQGQIAVLLMVHFQNGLERFSQMAQTATEQAIYRSFYA